MKNLMKNLGMLIVIFAVLAGNNFLVRGQPFGGGSGTQQAPYQLSTKQHLMELSDSLTNNPFFAYDDTFYIWSKDKYFILMNDITEPLNEPIGVASFPTNYMWFDGIFDGQNYSIALAIDDGGIVGLFASIGHFAVIKNLTVNGYVKGSWAAGIVGVQTDISMFDTNFSAKIQNVTNNAQILGSNYIGGVIGGAVAITIENCLNLGSCISRELPGHPEYIGGIIGMVCPPYAFFGYRDTTIITVRILNCINTGFIKGKDYHDTYMPHNKTFVGGIVGVNYFTNIGLNLTSCLIENCYSSGIVVGPEGNFGCIIGSKENNNILINNHYDKQMCGEEE